MKTNASTATPLPEYLTIEQTMELLQCGRSLAYQVAREHGIRIGRGKVFRIPRAAITAMTAA